MRFLVLFVGVSGCKVRVHSPFNLIKNMRDKNSKNETENLAENLTGSLTDSQLYQKCKKYGGNARLWMRKFEGLLPEVCRRRLYKRRGFVSIHEFAAKLAGMSHAKVDRILQLSRKLEDKPKLREVFESGEAGYSKVAKVVYVAKPETDKMWAGKVQNESQVVLELSVKEERGEEYVEEKSVLKNTFSQLSFSVSQSCERKFRALKQKLEKESGEAMSYGEVLGRLMEMVEKREAGVLVAQGRKVREKVEIKVCPDCAEKKAREAKGKSAPVSVKRLVLARQNNKCARVGCAHPPSELHHKNGYALTKNHSPEGLEYLCEKHHKIAHAQHEFVQVYRRE